MKAVILRFLFTFYFIHLLTFQATVLQAEKKKDELEKIIANRKEELVGNKNNKKDPLIQKKVNEVSNQAQIHWTTMEKLLWRTFLWKDLSNNNNDDLIKNFRRLKIIAQGFTTPGSKLEKNKKVRDDLIFALEWVYKNKYNEEKVRQEQEISPEAIRVFTDIVILMEAALTEAQLRKFANVILFHSKLLTAEDSSSELNAFFNSELLVAALMKNNSKVDSLVSKVNGRLTHTSVSDGFHEGGSLNNQASGITERVELFAAIADAYSILNSTKFQPDQSKGEILEAWMSREFIPQIFDHSFVDLRTENGPSSIEHHRTYLNFIEAASRISAFQKGTTNQKAFIKYLLEKLPANDLLQFDYKTLALSNEILLNKNISSKPLPANLKVYNNFKKITARRNEFFFGLRLDQGKTLIVNNIQNKGITSSQIDSLRIPGTTITVSAVKAGRNQLPAGIGNFMGGAKIDSLYASAGMEFLDENTHLKYKKSWFIFDNEIVALGAGISSKTSDEIESIIDQMDFDRDFLKVYEGVDSIDFEDRTIIKPAQFFFIKNSMDSLGRGYYFPLFQDVNGKVNSVKNRQSLTFSIIHPRKTSDAHYQYVLLPAISQDSMSKYDSDPDVIVLANNEKLQAVKEKNLNIIGANFWTKSLAELSVDGSFLITCNAPAAFMCIEKDGTLQMSISDPTKSNEGIIEMQFINKPLREVISKDERIEIIDIEGGKRILIDVKDAKGASLKVSFKLPEAETEN